MPPAPDTPRPTCIPFRPRQRRADAPPILRRHYRAARFLAIRSRQAGLTSHPACARYRLDRKIVIGHRALMRRLDCFQKQLITFHAHILPLLEHPTLLAPDTLATIIQDAARASSLFRTICVALAAPSIHRNPILPLDIFSALPEASVASPRPLVDPDGIFMDDRIS
ncbi:hypothetical protein DFH06DRAFT_1338968 [Mycena polygramma]|nr:hypothetical protein DFH06DRAFT_1338968 [Mycena polygramma]